MKVYVSLENVPQLKEGVFDNVLLADDATTFGCNWQVSMASMTRSAA